MATTPGKKVHELIDNTWQNQSPGDRLNSIEQIHANGKSGQEALIYIAHNDEHKQVRCGAIRFIHDLNSLLELQQADAEVAEAATQQYNRLLAGAIDSEITEQERLAIIESMSAPALKQIALLAKNKSAGTTAVARITAAEELADLSLYAASVHVRKLAVTKIEDHKLLLEIREKVRGKDKSVFKLVEQRLAATPVGKTKSPKTTATDAEPVATESVSSSVSEPVVNPRETVAAKSSGQKSSSKKSADKPAKPPKQAAAPLDPAVELPRMQQQLEKLSHKHTDALNALRNNLNKLHKAITASGPELEEQGKILNAKLAEKLEKNHVHQEQLQVTTDSLIQKLQEAMEAGQSHDALPAWDKIQGNISNTSGKIRANLQKKANVYKAKLNELRDWKKFAATEKKKELIVQMQHLLDSKMHAADRSKHISKMHREWKSLGRSNQNEQLWREFKKLSDAAYEPCKEYFKQRKQLMITNLVHRREICERLEAELAKLQDVDALKISDLNKLLNQAEQDWKTHAPIEQSKIKSMQKRYYGTVNQLRKLRKNSLRENGQRKQEFINQAIVLSELEDKRQAMNDAKNLQQEWKKIGPTSFKEDKKYWEDFRSACDKIFEKRNQEISAQRDNLKQVENNLSDLLRDMETILGLDDEAFRASRIQYQDTAQQFSSNLDPRLRKQNKQLQEQFNGIKGKIDARFKALPDKKQLQLKNSVLEKARFLQEIEDKLLASKDESQFLSLKQQIDKSAWEGMSVSGEQKYDEALNERLRRILKAESIASLRKTAEECASKVRALCIEAEIRANIDTPKEDQDLRMQIQLDQLKNGFGKLRPDRKENSHYAMDTELQSYCLGPLESKTQQLLSQRLEGAIKKLL